MSHWSGAQPLGASHCCFVSFRVSHYTAGLNEFLLQNIHDTFYPVIRRHPKEKRGYSRQCDFIAEFGLDITIKIPISGRRPAVLIDRALSPLRLFFELFRQRQIVPRGVTPHFERLRQTGFQMIHEAIEIDRYQVSSCNRCDILTIRKPATAKIPAALRRRAKDCGIALLDLPSMLYWSPHLGGTIPAVGYPTGHNNDSTRSRPASLRHVL